MIYKTFRCNGGYAENTRFLLSKNFNFTKRKFKQKRQWSTIPLISTYEPSHLAIHVSHISGTDRRLSSSQHDKYRYVSCHSWITRRQSSVGSWDIWSMNGTIHTCTYHADYKTIFYRFLRHVIHEWHDTYLYLSCWLEDNLLSVPDMWSMNDITDRRLSYSQHDKYRYVSCHSWITCQEPTEDCLLVNMISTGMYHAIHGSHLLSVPDMWSMNGMIHTCTYHVD
jgi:hypothetical protein